MSDKVVGKGSEEALNKFTVKNSVLEIILVRVNFKIELKSF